MRKTLDLQKLSKLSNMNDELGAKNCFSDKLFHVQ